MHLWQELVNDNTPLASPSPCPCYVCPIKLFVWSRYIRRIENLHRRRVPLSSALSESVVEPLRKPTQPSHLICGAAPSEWCWQPTEGVACAAITKGTGKEPSGTVRKTHTSRSTLCRKPWRRGDSRLPFTTSTQVTCTRKPLLSLCGIWPSNDQLLLDAHIVGK